MSRKFTTLVPPLFFAGENTLGGNNSWTKKASMDIMLAIMSPALRFSKGFVLFALLFSLPTLTKGQVTFVPQDGEYAVSGELNGDQTAPSVAINGTGGWVLWQDPGIDGKGIGIGARRLDASLNPSGAAFRFNSIVRGDQ